MARGWESKSVEAQIETAEGEAGNQTRGPLSLEQLQQLQKKEGLLLARARALQDLEAARNPRYRQMLQQVLAHLERELESLVPPR
ncbi:MAG: hypothetical protein H6Q05_1722 [Acidobacteria bacterium]|nr:hypothetical protein [Acidobacteriota bacterium]